MSGVVIRGESVYVDTLPEVSVSSWRDDPALQLRPPDYRERRTHWVRAIVLHTTKGIPGGRDLRCQDIRPGLGPDVGAEAKVARYWSTDSRRAGAHLVVDHDGSIACLSDLQTACAFHAGDVNDFSIGIEMYQGRDAELYQGQLEIVVRLVDWLTRVFAIQRQVHLPYRGRPLARGMAGGRTLTGVYGHRDCSDRRGAGDPGDHIIRMLADSGYETSDWEHDEDRLRWRARQEALGCAIIDGVPGPVTARALLDSGRPHGLWVPRPGD